MHIDKFPLLFSLMTKKTHHDRSFHTLLKPNEGRICMQKLSAAFDSMTEIADLLHGFVMTWTY